MIAKKHFVLSRTTMVLEHAQKLSTNGKRIDFQPPVLNWWKISDISKFYVRMKTFLRG